MIIQCNRQILFKKYMLNQSRQTYHPKLIHTNCRPIRTFKSMDHKFGKVESKMNIANKQNKNNNQNQCNALIKQIQNQTLDQQKRSSMDSKEQNNIKVYHQNIGKKIKPTVKLSEQIFPKNQTEVLKIHTDQKNEKVSTNIDYLSSNKALQPTFSLNQVIYKQINNMDRRQVTKINENNAMKKNSSILAQKKSKDGKYEIISRILQREQLKKASAQQIQTIKQNIKIIREKQCLESPRVIKIPKIEHSQTSSKSSSIVKAYAVNTHQGISRNYNEDRASVILNITKNGVKADYFAIFDGHGGKECCNFLYENLHKFILNSKSFPSNPRQAIIYGFKVAESQFIEKTKRNLNNKKQLIQSGSCAIVSLIVDKQIFIANLGDSRALISINKGGSLFQLSKDHKPTNHQEQQRILQSGGKIYRTEMFSRAEQNHKQKIIGPLRVYPGKLSVTRSFGDIEAKFQEIGGKINCISADPQICRFKIICTEDFIILGCDGIFEKLSSQDAIQQVWKIVKKDQKGSSIHQICGKAAEQIIKKCLQRRGTDNLTVIIIWLGELDFSNQISKIKQYSSL